MSPTEAKAPCGLLYERSDPLTVSNTLMVYSTLESAPKKTQNLSLIPLASRTLTISSTFDLAEEPEIARVVRELNGPAGAVAAP